jgi:hypothetical protein
VTSLYQQEMAKRGLVLPHATGCPRMGQPVRPLVQPVQAKDGRGRRRNPAMVARYAEWRKLYEVDGFGLTQIANESGYSIEGVRSALRTMGVRLRKRGYGTMREVLAEVEQLRSDNRLLKARVVGLRRRLGGTDDVAA